MFKIIIYSLCIYILHIYNTHYIYFSISITVGSTEASIALQKGQDRLSQNTHPDPYIMPYMPGGSLFMRNSPLPLEAVFPDGIPDDVSQ